MMAEPHRLSRYPSTKQKNFTLKLSDVFSLKLFPTLSLALNATLISRVVYEGENKKEEQIER